MQRLMLALVLGLVSTLTLAQATTWRNYANPEGGYSLQFPGTPKSNRKDEPAADGHVIRLHSQELEVGSTFWYTSWSELHPDAKRANAPREVLQDAANRSLERNKGTERERNALTLAGYPGLEIIYTVPQPGTPLILRQRMYIVGGRMLQQLYVGGPGSERSPDVVRFFESYVIRR